jgi:hypothetical protein
MSAPVKGPSSYFPAIEKKYGFPILEWQRLLRKHISRHPDSRHMELVGWLKAQHGMGHGHANAVVGHVLAQNRGQG